MREDYSIPATQKLIRCNITVSACSSSNRCIQQHRQTISDIDLKGERQARGGGRRFEKEVPSCSFDTKSKRLHVTPLGLGFKFSFRLRVQGLTCTRQPSAKRCWLMRFAYGRSSSAAALKTSDAFSPASSGLISAPAPQNTAEGNFTL